MRKKDNSQPQLDDCAGHSFNRRLYKHEKGTHINCYRCGAFMGCIWCCEALSEIICLRCHNWATRVGLEAHGNIIPNYKVQHVRTDSGWKHYDFNVGSPVDIVIRQAK